MRPNELSARTGGAVIGGAVRSRARARLRVHDVRYSIRAPLGACPSSGDRYAMLDRPFVTGSRPIMASTSQLPAQDSAARRRLLEARLQEAREAFAAEATQGRGGRSAHQLFSDRVDDVLRSMVADARPLARSPLAVAALGGYGRRALCLHSDIDLLIVFERPHRPRRRALRQGAAASALGSQAPRSATRCGCSTTSPSSSATIRSSCSRCSTRASSPATTALFAPARERLRALDRRRPRRDARRAADADRPSATRSSTTRSTSSSRTSRTRPAACATSRRRGCCSRSAATPRPRRSIDDDRLEQAEDFLLRVRSVLHLETGRNLNVLTHELQEIAAERLRCSGRRAAAAGRGADGRVLPPRARGRARAGAGAPRGTPRRARHDAGVELGVEPDADGRRRRASSTRSARPRARPPGSTRSRRRSIAARRCRPTTLALFERARRRATPSTDLIRGPPTASGCCSFCGRGRVSTPGSRRCTTAGCSSALFPEFQRHLVPRDPRLLPQVHGRRAHAAHHPRHRAAARARAAVARAVQLDPRASCRSPSCWCWRCSSTTSASGRTTTTPRRARAWRRPCSIGSSVDRRARARPSSS